MNAPSPAVNAVESPALAELVLRRSLEHVLGQSRLGCITAVVVSALLGTVFVPNVGWLSYGLWFGAVATGFITRQIWFERLRKTPTPSEQHLLWVTGISAVTGWLVILCVPLFTPSLPQDEAAFVFALMISWIAAAVAVLGVKPRIYGLYLCIALPTALYPMTTHTGVPPILLVAMALGGYLMFRMSLGIRALLVEAVSTGQRSEVLAQDLDRAMQQQKAAFLARSRFLAAASHDLRQPIHALSLLVNVLKKTHNEARRVEVVGEIERTSQSIQSMFRSLLDMAQIDADSMHATMERLDLLVLLQSVLAGCADRCADKGLQLHTDLPSVCFAQGDAILLERVLRNLLDNAVKYTRAGRVSVSASVQAGHVVIELTDTGVGMSTQDLDHLYQPFHRGASSRGSATDGLGLGLAIARHMIELMGASLHIQSVLGQGTTATVTLKAASQSGRVASTEEPTALLAGLRVLMVEDDAQARLALSLWLQESGAQVQTAASGQEAIELLQQGDAPDLLLADLTLDPGPDGLSVIAAWQEKHPSLQALLITGEDHIQDLPPTQPVLRKPVVPEALVIALESLLTNR
ncbi:hybrid sensor histidine kinase/response regulator [Hydrogenophaga sp.]|uniref:hybrid sensor histidine kinase/response regulator n=1 Tax=Hydrogenophaga sp. TaxID=1904254 RepID=UPI00272211CE|nr:hybrid sensor histidine kinase/response regulator [Hydrogenophaga sp.]MDO9131636.1 ATP-binding protein [Hydrogenophaga sp.]